MTAGQVVFVVPGRLDTRTGGSIYNRRIVEGLRALGWLVPVVEVPPPFPVPTPETLDCATRQLATLGCESPVVVDSLVLGTMPDVIIALARRRQVVALEHLPLSADLALDPSIRHQVEGGERRALGASAHIVVTGAAGLALLAPYELDAARITVVEPGVDRATMATPWSSGPVELLAVGTVNHNKGYDVLLDALATIRHLNWRLTCAGSLDRDSATAARVRALTTAHGLDTRVLWRGELNPDEVDACYRRAHVFVSTSRRETYGMAVAEALAHGLPVVATQTGAAASLVGTDAGLVAPIDDPSAVADVLDRLVSDATLRDRLVAGARRRRERLPSWEDAVARFSSMLGTLAPQASYD